MHTTHAAQSAVARDVMNREVITLQEGQSLDEAAAVLVEHDISGAPVVDGKGKVLGVVSVTDFMEDRTEGGDDASDELPAASGWRRFLNPEDLSQLRLRHSGRLVRDIMTPAVFTVPEDLTVAELARTMVAGRIHRLFVTRGANLVGIVTSLDLLKLLYDDDRPVA